MAFTLPVFNLAFNYWAPGVPPTLHVPTAAFTGQLYISSKGMLDITPSDQNLWVPPIYVRLSSSDFLLFPPACVSGIVQYTDPVLSRDFFYVIRWWEWTHKGFPNEYVSLIVEQSDAGGLTPDPGR